MTSETILVVEDDEDIQELLTYNLKAAGYGVVSSKDGYEALDAARKRLPDLILLDLMMPGISGFDVCRELRRDERTARIPVIMLTARGDEVDRIVGLELGADDYVVKPFSPRELLLRIKAVLKRLAPETRENQALRKGALTVDLDAHRAFLESEEIQLTATEFKLLADLIRAHGRVRTRDHLLNAVWGYEFDGYARTVDTHVRRLRQKLGACADMVETVRGVGYRFKE
jgi:phosphate regulon transcriptional regulator PhoB